MSKTILKDGTILYGEIGDKGYRGLRGDIDYNKITQTQKDNIKHLIDMNYLEDAKEYIECILSCLYNETKEV